MSSDSSAPPDAATDHVAASALARATYCPRQLYYARREDDRSPPPAVAERKALAFRYPALRGAANSDIRDLPISVPPDEYRENLDRLAEREDWGALADPPIRDALLTGKDCRGIADKVLPGDDADSPPVPTLVAAGEPPEHGVWEPHGVRATAIAKMLAWERGREVPEALVEYPVVGVVRSVRVTARRAGRYRQALRTVREMDGPPPRLSNDAKCESCDYLDECGVKTRSLRSLFGL